MPKQTPYPAAFRTEAIRFVCDHSILPSQVASDLRMDRNTLQRWLQETAPVAADAEPPVLATKLTRLRREIEHLRMERAIEKQAIGIFSRMPQ